jgi:acetylornithine deacetylase/succinyl-diaminopimelate desuccinylase-like protein
MIDRHKAAIEYARGNSSRFLEELKEFVAIPSISTDPSKIAEMDQAARWVARQFEDLGMSNVQIFPTRGHPVVFGELQRGGSNLPTILVYGHYDVQPAEPLELWESGAFQPEVRGDSLYGRGAADMKGQVVACLKAIESIVRTGELQVNLKMLVEGEEEIGSPNLGEFIADHQSLLACDFALNPDSGTISADYPTITYGLRGLAYFELRVYGPDHDLHSGSYGGVVNNPAQVLAELIAGMHDGQGRVTLPGFYDKVRPLAEDERANLARLPTDEAFYLTNTGAPTLWGETGYTPTERVGARPTLEVNGLFSGFTGEGSKTVLPARAMAKISTRLVPDQDPEEVHQQLKEYLKRFTPETVRYELDKMVGGPAVLSDRKSNAIKAMESAMGTVWGNPPLFRREGGSVPVVVMFRELLNIESVNIGFALLDCNAHGPNEKQHLPTWNRGIETLIYFFSNQAD